MAYHRTNWKSGAEGGTLVTDERLNNIEDGIEQALAGVPDVALPDAVMTTVAADPTSAFATLQSATIAGQIDTDVPPLVADALAADPTVAQAAADAVGTAMASGAAKSTIVSALGVLVENKFKSPRGTVNDGGFPSWAMSAQGGGASAVSLDATGWEDGGPCAKITWTTAPTNTWLGLAISNVTTAYVAGHVYSFSVEILPNWSGRFRCGVQFYTAAGAYISNTVGLAVTDVAPGNKVTTLTISAPVPANTGYARIMIQQAIEDTPFFPPVGGVLKLRGGLVHEGMGPVPYVDPTAATAYPVGTLDASASRFVAYSNAPRYVCVGDSLTYGSGSGGQSFPVRLNALTGVRAFNLGYPGETSQDMAARLTSGFLVAFAGGTVPASGTVNVGLSFLDGSPVTSAMKAGVTRIRYVMCAGATWTLSWSGTSYQLTRSIAGAASTVIGPQVAVTDQSIMHRGDTAIIWAGRNDFAAADIVLASIRAMVGNLTHRRYLVLSVLNGTAEPSGNADYTKIVALNTALAHEHGGKYVDVRRALIDSGLAIEGITPTAQDTTDIGNDVPPLSLRSDALHLNPAGYDVIARLVVTRLASLGW